MHKRVLAALLASSCAAAAVYAPPALARAGDTDPREYDIAEQPLGDALREFARISGRVVVAMQACWRIGAATASRGSYRPRRPCAGSLPEAASRRRWSAALWSCASSAEPARPLATD